ncbi:MAG: alpha-galactosidase [Oscillospiraceae bacterium]|nr:alpha-galactosidase [Oscillospiraceae bacterium]
MDKKIFLETPHFSFKHNGETLNGFESETVREVKKSSSEDGEAKYCITYSFENGIKVREELSIFEEFDAAKILLHFENTSAQNSGQLSEICDCDISLPFNENYKPPAVGHRLTPQNKARIFKAVGSNWVRDEFFQYADYLAPGQVRSYSCEHGRSSQGLMPYFEINENEKGALLAIGWTGQWNVKFTGEDKKINIKTQIEGVDFYLEPHEQIRTSSAVVMFYENGRDEACNTWRRFFKKHITNMGKGERPKEGPLAASAWGAVSSDKMIERIKKIKANGIGAEYYWIDAGWYGYSTAPCPTEHDGDWGAHTGSWVVNKTYHPDGLLEVAKTIKENGMKFILWIEPERVLRNTDMPKEHPDWFLEMSPEDPTLLLDLSNPEAIRGTYELVAEYIEKFDLKCYRQDFNTNPLAYWRKYDKEGRCGLKEIKYITGLYEFWDMLLERFPDLFIDNCASGGRRNDIEMMSRSMPLWRSDYQCTFDYESEVSQIHTTGINRWLVYHGTGLGRYVGDAYRFRSAYAPSLTSSFWMYEDDDFAVGDNKNDAVKKYFAEYKSIRPYLSCDYYPLVENSTCDTTWCAWQYNRPENGDGIILAFRRPDSPMSKAEFALKGLCEGNYKFVDADSGEEKSLTLDEINTKGFEVVINERRASKLIRYHKI